MRLQIAVDIAAPRARVWAAFTDTARLHEWQATLRSFAPVSGAPGAVGSITNFVYREGGRDVAIRETIIERDEGRVLTQRLDAEMMSSVMRNVFSSPRENVTRWTLDCNITFRGMWRLFGALARPLLVRKTRLDMERFRGLVERRS
jgi:uncharacterized protein YndB with AHSA1/START domain